MVPDSPMAVVDRNFSRTLSPTLNFGAEVESSFLCNTGTLILVELSYKLRQAVGDCKFAVLECKASELAHAGLKVAVVSRRGPFLRDPLHISADRLYTFHHAVIG